MMRQRKALSYAVKYLLHASFSKREIYLCKESITCKVKLLWLIAYENFLGWLNSVPIMSIGVHRVSLEHERP